MMFDKSKVVNKVITGKRQVLGQFMGLNVNQRDRSSEIRHYKGVRRKQTVLEL